jgi:hypothetical protein
MKTLIKILTIVLVGILFIKTVNICKPAYIFEHGNDGIIRYYENERLV